MKCPDQEWLNPPQQWIPSEALSSVHSDEDQGFMFLWIGGFLSPITRHALTFTTAADAVMILTSVRSTELHKNFTKSRIGPVERSASHKASWETFIREFSASVSCLYGGNILIQDKIRESVTGAGQLWV